VTAPDEELQHPLADQPVLNGDQTGNRTNGVTRWLWTLVAPTFIFYTQLQRINGLAYLTAAIHCRRRGQVVASLLSKRRTS
jgi:hypothetical protein